MSAEGVAGEKAAMRAAMRAGMASLDTASRAREAGVVVQAIAGLEAWRMASAVGLFLPFGDEIPVGELVDLAWALGKVVALPAWRGPGRGFRFCAARGPEDLVVDGRFGIREPGPACPEVGAASLDFVAVPGLAFDPSGRRLGRGKGFYDRLLSDVVGTTCGVGYGLQLVPLVPVEAHDMTLNLVATARGLVGPAACRS